MRLLHFVIPALAFTLSARAVDRLAALEKMEPVIADCVQHEDNPEYPVFHGCWDWHSAAHAHWALFRIARVRGTDSAATRWAERSLDPKALESERARLQKEPSFENPYGRAWFLRLVIDFEGWAKQNSVALPERLRPLGELVASSLRAHYAATAPDPDSAEYENASWAFAQLAAYYRHTGNRAAYAEVDQVIRRDFLESHATLSFDSDTQEFFSRYGNWLYLVARTQPGGDLAAFLRAHPLGENLAPIPPTEGVSHSLALNWSRAWALAALAARVKNPQTKAALLAAYDAHVARGLEDHETYKGDYRAYGHWVAQFAVYALTESLGY